MWWLVTLSPVWDKDLPDRRLKFKCKKPSSALQKGRKFTATLKGYYIVKDVSRL